MLAEQLLARAPGSVAAMVPANTGTEAVEAAIKIARAATGRPRVLYADHAFHGLTLGSLSLNGNEEFRAGFGPLLPGCDPVPFGDAGALEQELAQRRRGRADHRAGPGQGRQPSPRRLSRGGAALLSRRGCAVRVRRGADRASGRTGRFLALEHWDLSPDIICMAKALSGGLVPIGAVLVSREAFDRVFDGMERAVRHGSTFGGNDLSAAAALATLRVFERDDVVGHAARMGELLLELTRPLVDRHEVVRDVRGLGLMWAIELGPPAGGSGRALWDAVERAQPGLFAQLITVPLFHDHQILCQVAGHRMNVVKALPSLLIEEDEVRRFADALAEVVAAAERMPRAMARFGLQMARGTARSRRPRRRVRRSMRALVTGAAGFIGGHVVAVLAAGGARGHSVRSSIAHRRAGPGLGRTWCSETCSIPTPSDAPSRGATRSFTWPRSIATRARDAALMQCRQRPRDPCGARRSAARAGTGESCTPARVPPADRYRVAGRTSLIFRRDRSSTWLTSAPSSRASAWRSRRPGREPRWSSSTRRCPSARAISVPPRPARWSPTSPGGAPARTSPTAR